ncbi:MAG: hypothetical protein LBJ67_05615 [Planctomycetaceae bacterium]|jgi:hypothetical protein|nr:hypothetical protein [Planctomycetaceae bacterium]
MNNIQIFRSILFALGYFLITALNFNENGYVLAQNSSETVNLPEETVSALGLSAARSNTTDISDLPKPRESDPILGARIANLSPLNFETSLPHDHGQIGREYDITPYTSRPTQSPSPQLTIINWILRQTGQAAWHTEPFGFLNATHDKLTVYHTVEIQKYIADTIDRFVNPKLKTESYSLRIFSISSPDWRNRNRVALVPIRINTPGIQGWLIGKNQVGLFFDAISKRNDVREHISSHTALLNGQTTVVPYHVSRNYVRDVQPRANVPGGYLTDPASLNEGFQFEITPLLGLDGKTSDVRIKCDFVEVEKMHQLIFSTPSAASPSSRVTVEVPQVANFSVDEMICWPRDYVLLLDLGIVPMLIPTSATQTSDKNLLEQIIAPVANSTPPKRSDVLIAIELQTVGITTSSTVNSAYSATNATTNPAPQNQNSPLEITFDLISPAEQPQPTTSTPPVLQNETPIY